MWNKYKIDAEGSEAEKFSKKYKIRALKLLVMLLNCTLGPPNLKVGRGVAPPPPGSASVVQFEKLEFNDCFTTHVSRAFKTFFVLFFSFLGMTSRSNIPAVSLYVYCR